MTLWLLANSVRRAPRRLALAALGVAFPVAVLAATLLFVDGAVRQMTKVALEPVQVEMRALATSLNVDMAKIGRKLAAIHGVRRVERFAAADVIVSAPGTGARATARLFAVDPGYIAHHPWVRVVKGGLVHGALLNGALLGRTGFGSAKTVTIELSGGNGTLAKLPVTGAVDVRHATTWFSIPTGDVQGDVAVVPRSVVIDYATFQSKILPALKASLGTTTAVLNPGLVDLPPVSVEAHIAVDHSAYPSDPARASGWSTGLQHLLERQAPGEIVVADGAAEPLLFAKQDSTNAKILFLLLGIPGVLVAAGLGLAAESALAEARRREEALLRLRGATDSQLVKQTAAQAALAGVLGAALGIVVAGAAVSAVNGRAIWSDVPAGRIAVSLGLAVAAGALVVGFRLFRLVRASRRSEVTAERRLLERGWAPAWRRHKLDLAAIAAGLAILLVNLFAGGLKQTQVEGTSLALSFYVLLAPIALWLGVSLLAIRGLLIGLGRWARPDRARPLGSWAAATLRWLGRRPARTAVALVLGTLAVAFGTSVVAFTGTYRAAKQADNRAAFGSDIHLTPATELPVPLPRLRDVTTTPIRVIPVRAGTDRKSVMTIDPTTYRAATTMAPIMVAGRGLDALAHDPNAVLVSQEIVGLFAVRPGDPLPVTVFPDDEERSRNVTLHVAGIYRSWPPTDPPTELVMSARRFPTFLLPVPEYYLGRVAPGHTAAGVARDLGHSPVARSFRISTIATNAQQTGRRSLTSLNLGGLNRIESIAAALVAAVGVAVLGAFLVFERRREFAVLRTLGAEAKHELAAPTQEGAIAVLGSLVLGVPIGLGLGMLAVRVLGLFFTLPPPVLSFSVLPLLGFVALTVLTSALALAGALVAVRRIGTAVTLREP